MDQTKIRVRYAPSPTGFLHIGGARSALFNFLFAKKHQGKFIIRIEDTDIERNIEGGEISQINDLMWLGIIPDESPLKPNPTYAPYRQMERLALYQKYGQELLKNGQAYECYCSEAELERSREEQLASGIVAPQYNRRCLHLNDGEKQAFINEGRKPVLRIKLEDHLTIQFLDLVRGPVSFNNDDIGDWVLIKSNGIPTYNFAVVIDDYTMDITHVLRGEEHLSNTPKQIQLYRYFNWPQPAFGHMTIIVNNQGKKLSKRDGSIVQFMSQYRNLGYLPEAIMNFILLLGWAPEGTQEIFTLSQAIESFDAARLSSAPSTFDPQKLMWLNNHYIKAMNHEAYLAFIAPFVAHIPDIASWTVAQQQTLALLFKDQIQYGQQIIELASAIVTPKFAADEDTLQFMHAAESTQALAAVIAYLQAQATIDFHTIKTMFKTLQTTTGLKGKALFMPVRIQLTGQLHGAELAMIMPLLGKEETLKRLKHPWTLS